VGGAYVHGKIDGEPLREIEAEGRKEEIVFLMLKINDIKG
jgi:hypothetical protein